AEGGPFIAAVLRFLRWIVALVKGPEAQPPTSPGEESAVSLRAVPRNRPAPSGNHASPYLLQWERRFDRLHPLSGSVL
ncbi:hypothetical protein, partial [Glycomyces tenuis]